MKNALLASVVLASLASPAHAGITAGEFLRYADNPPQSAPYLYALGYVSAAAQGAIVLHDAHASLPTTPLGDACIPEGVKDTQALAVAKKYIRGHPEVWHLDVYVLVAASFADAWPCR